MPMMFHRQMNGGLYHDKSFNFWDYIGVLIIAMAFGCWVVLMFVTG